MADPAVLSELTSISYLTLTEECDKTIDRVFGETDTIFAMQNKFPNVAECAEGRRYEALVKFETLHSVMLKILDKLEMVYDHEQLNDEVQHLEGDSV